MLVYNITWKCKWIIGLIRTNYPCLSVNVKCCYGILRHFPICKACYILLYLAAHLPLCPPSSPSQIIQRRKRSEMQTEYDFVWPQPQSLIQPSELPSPSQPQASSQQPQDPLKTSYSLWVSVSIQAKFWKCCPKIILTSQNKIILSVGVNCWVLTRRKSKEEQKVQGWRKAQFVCPHRKICSTHRNTYTQISNAHTPASGLQQGLEEICRCPVCERSIKAALPGPQFLFPAVSLNEDQSPVKYEGILLNCMGRALFISSLQTHSLRHSACKCTAWTLILRVIWMVHPTHCKNWCFFSNSSVPY